jgi:hypothetical protein
VSALEPRLIRVRHQEREQPQNAAGLLKSGQRLPLPLEHGQQRRVEWIGRGESVLGLIDGEPVRDLGPMGLDPIGVFGGGLLRVVRQASPLEETPPDNLRRLRLCRHDHGLAETVEELLTSLEVCLVLGCHLVHD